MRNSIAWALLALSGIARAQTSESLSKIAERIDRVASNEPAELAADVRLQTAAAVRGVDPELARRLIDKSVTGVEPQAYPGLLMLLIANDKAAATRFFRGIPLDHAAPGWDRWLVLRCIMDMAGADSAEASAALQKVSLPKDQPEFRRAVGALLHVIDHDAYEHRADLAAEDISAMSRNDAVKLARQLISNAISTNNVPATPDPAVGTIASRLKELRGDLSPSARAALAESFAADIRALRNPQARLGLAASLSNLATEGDLGKKALQTVTDTLGAAIRDAKPNNGGPFLTLAKLVRYEHLKSPIENPSLESRLELLHLRELAAEQTDFKLTGIDGKAYSLKELRGKVVLVNFWATWCPPCRKEMPDLQELSRRFHDQGLVILAVSDEPADTVKPFIAKQGYTFTVLLDPDRQVNTAFHVEGIPKTFVFNREGKLAAQSIDMRTREQFLVLLKQAGLD